MSRRNSPRIPELKSDREIQLMREAGKLVATALQMCREMSVPGTKTIDMDRAVEEFFARHQAFPLFKGYPGRTPYPACTCISVNEQVVHGIPGPRVLKDGDLVSIDTACRLDGWCADAAITVPVGAVRPERLRLLKVSEEVLAIAAHEMGRCRWWSEVASKMQAHAESAGFSVVTQYVGHGIGRTMHESPQVPNFVTKDPVMRQDFRLEPGLVIAVEPMVNMARPEVVTLSDHWTVVTRDGLPSVHVEHTLALTRDGVFVVTAPPGADPLTYASLLQQSSANLTTSGYSEK
ncbi:type I methionyl aminopeptidase [Tuwongella immobilis]|uniref:Methionine aminopeptidase n=1 Tax=Tuwongella immobilis TaxID=692036 RepID=A0A6C2YM83_9BACT|nr:type I methionyl aminopeptidase [Tuwongella immobilis]VIP02708.1 methionine aminopeptidase : Methionine aminopeptidase OS=Singulisphaera acidiphila (strain ATCC BAA-1392 / DSM 18658 / VKM B-2454 / MOB10) GN=map PE=3 SV=1: Peptidase_M24 [Tuwongella immobilis]VTS02214.1 methionine aminopeptidase : Methionine aminopeptidase OS=Singulisphaera acidiphila (strain ATCC BAA-1392 / DSM 18658 / VKM B-2454 / MOB10) GN=map PE=3 SV=1: Peptidase_M24 [Tuwongella immobilis]